MTSSNRDLRIHPKIIPRPQSILCDHPTSTPQHPRLPRFFLELPLIVAAPFVPLSMCLRHVEVLRQHLGLKLGNQPLECGDFRFKRLDTLLQFGVGDSPRLERSLYLERDADLV